MQKLKIRKIGNSLGAIFNTELVAHLNVQEGDEVMVCEDQDGVRLSTYDPEFEAAMAIAEEGFRDFRNALKKLAE